MSIGENVRALRMKKNLTQEELATKVGVTKALISAIENDIRTLSVPVARAIANALGCSITEVIG